VEGAETLLDELLLDEKERLGAEKLPREELLRSTLELRVLL
jgi:hypothetical protein